MIALVGALYALAMWAWVQYLPGYFLSRALVPAARGVARHGLALVCGFSTVPLAVFLVSVGASIPLDADLLLTVGSGVNLIGAALLRPWKDPQIGVRDTAAVLVAGLLCALYLAFGIRSLDVGDVFSTVHHCLYVIVMHAVQNDPSVSIPLYDGLSGEVMHYLVQHQTEEFNGLGPLFYEQRLGNAAILTPQVALFGSAGWFTTAVYASLVAGVCVYLAARETGVRAGLAALAAAVFVIAMRGFCMYFVNENSYAVALVAFLLWAALRRRPPHAGWVVLMGLTCGHLLGVRYTSSLFWPAVLAAVLWWPEQSWRARLRSALLGAGCALLAAAPWLYVNTIMLGSPFAHPKVHSEFASRMVENRIFGLTFRFRALNWPFTDSLVRTAWAPFPTLLWLPLTVAKYFGHLGVALALRGWWTALARRRTFGLLLLFALPHTAAMAMLESLDHEQLTYAAPGLVPLGVALAMGLEATVGPLLAEPRRWRRPLLILLAIVVSVSGGIRMLRHTTWPVDTRLLDPALWPEAPAADAGVLAQRDDLTSIRPLPAMPVWRTTFAPLLLESLAAAVDTPELGSEEGLPLYPSGQLAILVGYAAQSRVTYQAVLEGAPPRTVATPLRTGMGLHTVTLGLPAEKLRVQVSRNQGDYDVLVQPLGAATSELRDFTFYLHPWNPPLQSITIRHRGEGGPGGSSDEAGRPLESLRVLTYGGDFENREQRYLATNYPAEILGMVAIAFEVDPAGEAPHCGLFVFFSGVDVTHVETLALRGGNDRTWRGERRGEIVIPSTLLADTLVLYSEPYCSDHVPQHGDRYGAVKGPFTAGRTLHIKLDQRWP